MAPKNQRVIHKPHHSLVEVCQLLTRARMRGKPLMRTMDFMGDPTETEARDHAYGLIRSLTGEDFFKSSVMSPAEGGYELTDEYGKKDEYGLWFIKFAIVTTESVPRLRIWSCHEAEWDMILNNGTELKK